MLGDIEQTEALLDEIKSIDITADRVGVDDISALGKAKVEALLRAISPLARKGELENGDVVDQALGELSAVGHTPSPRLHGLINRFKCNVLLLKHQYESGLILAQEALDLSLKLGDRRGAQAARINTSAAKVHLGDIADARQLLEEARREAKHLGTDQNWIHVNLAEVAGLQTDWAAAKAYAAAVVQTRDGEHAEEENGMVVGVASIYLARALRHENKFPEARQAIDRCMHHVGAIETFRIGALTESALIDMAEDASKTIGPSQNNGALACAWEKSQEALTLLAQFPSSLLDETEVRVVAADLSHQLGRAADADRMYLQAFERLSAKPPPFATRPAGIGFSAPPNRDAGSSTASRRVRNPVMRAPNRVPQR